MVEGMKEIVQLMEEWQLNVGDLRERMYRAPTPRERERWHGLWLLAQGWSAIQVAEALERASYHWKLAGQLSPRRGPRFGL